MRHIDKTKTTRPDFLLRFRKQTKDPISYGEMRKLVDSKSQKYCKCEGTKEKPDIGIFEMQLLQYQGFLCAYCNNKIPEFKKTNSGKYCKVKVEHWHPESSTLSDKDKLDTDYNNMLICCKGGEINNEETYYCDTAKKELFMTLDPREKSHINKLKYTENGQIYCIDFEDKKTLKSQYDEIKNKKATPITYRNGKIGYFLEAKNLTDDELNIAIQYDLEFTLNLNIDKLKYQREAKWKNINDEVSQKFKQPHLFSAGKRQFLNNKISFFDTIDDNGEYEPMCMVKILYLRKRLKRLKEE